MNKFEDDDIRHQEILRELHYYIEDIELMQDSKYNAGYYLYKLKGIKAIFAFLLFLSCFI